MFCYPFFDSELLIYFKINISWVQKLSRCTLDPVSQPIWQVLICIQASQSLSCGAIRGLVKTWGGHIDKHGQSVQSPPQIYLILLLTLREQLSIYVHNYVALTDLQLYKQTAARRFFVFQHLCVPDMTVCYISCTVCNLSLFTAHFKFNLSSRMICRWVCTQ